MGAGEADHMCDADTERLEGVKPSLRWTTHSPPTCSAVTIILQKDLACQLFFPKASSNGQED